MHTISRCIVNFLSSNATSNIERKDWCIYALEKKLYKALCFAAVLFVGLCFNAPIECAFVFVTTNYLRTKISGWHAQSPVFCVILTIGLCCGGGYAANWMAVAFPAIFLLWLFVNICLCLFFTPIDNLRLHLTA